MRLAILSDIHGNKPALDAVIADIEARQPDRVIVAGDLVNRGPGNRAVVEAVAERDWEVIRGNHDALVVSWARGNVPAEWYDDPWWNPVEWVAEQIHEFIPYLDTLPFDVQIDVDGAEPVRIVHGSPRKMREGLHHFLSDEQITDILAGVPESVIICAHTHIPMERRVNGLHVINAGAVGLPFNLDTRAQYVLLTLMDNGRWDVNFRAIEYDLQAALKAFDTSGYIEEGLAAWLFQREVETARNHLFPFEQWATMNDLPLCRETWQRYLDREVAASSFFARYAKRPAPAG